MARFLLFATMLITQILVGQQPLETNYQHQQSLQEFCEVDGRMTGHTKTYVLEYGGYKVATLYRGKRRPLSKAARIMLSDFAIGKVNGLAFSKRFKNEYLFQEGATRYWMPIQSSLEPEFQKEVAKDSTVTLLVYRLGTVGPRWIVVINGYSAGREVYRK